MTEKKSPPRNFRPWPDNQERLELAEKLGLNVSELINEVLQKNIARHLEQKAKQIREALAPTR
jgi:post-segregation antitoxin (ccd killing protein)